MPPEAGNNPLTRKLGPLPVWAWGGIAAAIVLFLVIRSRSSSGGGTATSSDTQSEPDTSAPYNVSSGSSPFDPSQFGSVGSSDPSLNIPDTGMGGNLGDIPPESGFDTSGTSQGDTNPSIVENFNGVSKATHKHSHKSKTHKAHKGKSHIHHGTGTKPRSTKHVNAKRHAKSHPNSHPKAHVSAAHIASHSSSTHVKTTHPATRKPAAPKPVHHAIATPRAPAPAVHHAAPPKKKKK